MKHARDKAGRHKGEGLRRRPGFRREKTRVLIVCEGRETEPNYFRGLRDEPAVRDRFVLEIRKGRGGSPTNAIQKALEDIDKAQKRGEQFDGACWTWNSRATGAN